MKYCPNCGAALGDGTASFCSECGNQLNLMDETAKASGTSKDEAIKDHKKPKKEKKEKPKKQKAVHKKQQKEPKMKHKRQQKEHKTESDPEPMDDGYDGYYNDVLPPDMDRVKEGLDKELIKKIAAVAVGVIFIISMCVVMLYVL